MTRGRKPKPEKLLRLHGTFQPCRRKKTTISADGAPSCPVELKGEARKEWNRIVPDLDALGILSKCDRAGLVALCKAWALYVEAEKDIELNGISLQNLNGVKKNPACTVAHEAFSRWNTLCAKFGLTPSDREKMPVGKQDEDNPFVEFQKKA